MKSILSIVALSLVFVTSLCHGDTNRKKFSSLLEDVGIKSSASELPVFLSETPVDATEPTWKSESKGQVIYFETRSLESIQAQQQIDLQINAIESLYKDGVTPYQGAITNTQSCPKDRKPNKEDTVISGLKIYQISAAVSDRNAFGNCFDKNSRGGAVALFYVPSTKNLVVIKYFDKSIKNARHHLSKIVSGFKTVTKK